MARPENVVPATEGHSHSPLNDAITSAMKELLGCSVTHVMVVCAKKNTWEQLYLTLTEDSLYLIGIPVSAGKASLVQWIDRIPLSSITVIKEDNSSRVFTLELTSPIQGIFSGLSSSEQIRAPESLLSGLSSVELLSRQSASLLKAIQESWATYWMVSHSLMKSLAVITTPGIKNDTDTRSPNTTCFERSGYSFYAESQYTDENETDRDRPFSTYHLKTDEEEEGLLNGGIHGWGSDAQLIVKIGRIRGAERWWRNENMAAASGETASTSAYRFRIWSETLARALAKWEIVDTRRGNASIEMTEQDFLVFRNQYFDDDSDWIQFCSDIESSNFSDDESMASPRPSQSKWSYQLFSFCTRYRIVTMVSVRRKYLPPYLDSYQDLVFISFTSRKVRRLDEGGSREMIMAEQRKLCKIVASMRPIETHDISELPYQDRSVLKARVNSLGCDRETFRWFQRKLATVPDLEFVGVPCQTLCIAFCGSLIQKYYDVTKLKNDVSRDPVALQIKKINFVDSPLSVIFRLHAEMQDSHSDPEVMHEWSRRVSAYFSYFVEEAISYFSGKLSISILCGVIAVPEGKRVLTIPLQDSPDLEVIEKVLEYLLFLRCSKDEHYSMDALDNADTLYQKVLKIATSKESSFSCNEDVLIQILDAGICGGYDFFGHILLQKHVELGHPSEPVRSILAMFYSKLLLKSYNLELMEKVFEKLRSCQDFDYETFSLHILPRVLLLLREGNFYVQSWATETIVGLSDMYPQLLVDIKNIIPVLLKRVLCYSNTFQLKSSLRLLSMFGSAGLVGVTTDIGPGGDFESLLASPIERILTMNAFHQYYEPEIIQATSTLITRLTQKPEQSDARMCLLQRNVHLHLLKFLTNPEHYLEISRDVAAALGCLLYKCPSSLKAHPLLVSSIPELLQLATLTYNDSNRRRSMQIIRLLRNLSYKCEVVLIEMHRLGIDKVLKQIYIRMQHKLEEESEPSAKKSLDHDSRLVQLVMNRVESPMAAHVE